MSDAINSTTVEGSESGKALDYVLATVIPTVFVLLITICLVYVIWTCYKKKWRYKPVPTRDEQDQPPRKQSSKREVNVSIPDPPPPRIKITTAPNLAESSFNSQFTAHKLPVAVEGKESNDDEEGVAGQQAYVCLNINLERNKLSVEVQKAVGLPRREDGTLADPFVRLIVMSREKRNSRPSSRRKVSSTNHMERTSDPTYMQTLDCGSVVKEELANSILQIQVVDHLQDLLLAEGEVGLDQIESTKTFRVPLKAITHQPSVGRILISLYHDVTAATLSITITKLELLADTLPSNECWIKIEVTKGTKCLLNKKTRSVKVLQREVTLDNTFVCYDVTDASCLTLQCGVLTTITTSLMKRTKLLGKITLGSHEHGQALRHWTELVDTPDTVIAEWHNLT